MTTDQLTQVTLAAEQKSAEVTDWASRIGWLVGLALFVVLVYWLMRQGWKWRSTLQGDLPELPAAPEDTGPTTLTMSGRYHGSTTAGQWLDRIVAHGLGTRSRAEVTLSEAGIDVVRPGANDFFIPRSALREARLDKGIAGKVLTEGGLLIITWQHGERLLDSGFRSDRAAEQAGWVEAVNSLVRAGDTDADADTARTDTADTDAPGARATAAGTTNTATTTDSTEGAAR